MNFRRSPFLALTGSVAPFGLAFGLALSVVGCGAAAPVAPPLVCPPPMTPTPPPKPTPPPGPVTTADDVAKQLIDAYNGRDSKTSFGLMNTKMQALLPIDKESVWIDGMLSRGPLDPPARVAGDGKLHGIYELKAPRGMFRAELDIDPDGKISGLQVKEVKLEPPVVKSTLPIALPFKGEWLVFWGGDTAALNQHVGNPSQRRAADLEKVDNEGKDKTGDGKKNTDYFSFGAEILAVADGTVLTASDGVHDNDPGVSNPYAATGNTIIIAHEGGVQSLYAHLKNHSGRVKEGMKVKKGQVLALCGNSGQSSQPHLHFQLQDGPNMESSWGIEAVFPEVRLTRDGRTSNKKDYTFLKNDRIETPH